jgi:hypothetical protein
MGPDQDQAVIALRGSGADAGIEDGSQLMCPGLSIVGAASCADSGMLAGMLGL